MATSSIEWTELTWNPTTGCDKVSAGCKFCYAEIMSRRLQAMGVEKYADGFKVRQHEAALAIPYGWKKPAMVFVNSMSDLFHKDMPLEFIQKVFKVMNEWMESVLTDAWGRCLRVTIHPLPGHRRRPTRAQVRRSDARTRLESADD
jgi:protein gp37